MIYEACSGVSRGRGDGCGYGSDIRGFGFGDGCVDGGGHWVGIHRGRGANSGPDAVMGLGMAVPSTHRVYWRWDDL